MTMERTGKGELKGRRNGGRVHDISFGGSSQLYNIACFATVRCMSLQESLSVLS